MEIKYLGTAAAEGIPAVFCNCATCIKARENRDIRTRSQVIINDEVSIDYPPDSYYHSLAFNVDLAALKYLLVTHSHMDHFYAHDFILRGYKYAKNNFCQLNIFGNDEVKKVFEECTRREMREDVRNHISLKVVEPFIPFSFGVNNQYTVVSLKAKHSQLETALVYLIENRNQFYLHLTDTGLLEKESLEYLIKYIHTKNKKISLGTFDCTFLREKTLVTSRHMGIEDNMILKKQFIEYNIVDRTTKYVITHFSHNYYSKEELKKIEKEYDVIAAYDGLEIVL